jgi:hypothetical protein
VNERRDNVLRRTLRGVVLGCSALALAAIVASVVAGGAHTHRALGFSAFACWIVAPGLVLWLHPRISIAILWSMLAWFGFLMGLNLPWPGATVAYLMMPVLIVLLFGLPIGAALYRAAIVRADARAARLSRPELPPARVVNRRAV